MEACGIVPVKGSLQGPLAMSNHVSRGVSTALKSRGRGEMTHWAAGERLIPTIKKASVAAIASAMMRNAD